MSEDPPSPDITVDAAWRESGIDLVACAKASVRAVLRHHGLHQADVEIGIRFADDPTVRALNAEWRGQDKVTDVLAFPVTDTLSTPTPGQTFLLGDVVLAWETCARDADELGRPLADHVRHLLVHGLLHLLHHDHDTPRAARAMERLEVMILADLGVTDPYADRPLCEETS